MIEVIFSIIVLSVVCASVVAGLLMEAGKENEHIPTSARLSEDYESGEISFW